jgi:hemoglobin-like flavoprotein
MLTMALVTVEHHFAHSYPATEHYLHVLGHRHHQWGIPRSLFPAFGKCLLETLAEIHGADWEPQLETQWREAYERTAETMLEGYDKPYIY